MVGMPGETEDEIQKTYQFVVMLKEKYPACQPLVTPFRLFPGSKLYEIAVSEYGYKSPESLLEWVEMDDKEYSEAVGYQNTKYYPWIRDAKKFESRHKIFTIFRVASWSLSPYLKKMNIKSRIRYFVKRFLYKIAALRIRKDFYNFNIEYFLLELWRNGRSKIQSFKQ